MHIEFVIILTLSFRIINYSTKFAVRQVGNTISFICSITQHSYFVLWDIQSKRQKPYRQWTRTDARETVSFQNIGV